MIVFMQITNASFSQFVNNNFIVMEIVKEVAGSLGIILAAPLMALISSYLLPTKVTKKEI